MTFLATRLRVALAVGIAATALSHALDPARADETFAGVVPASADILAAAAGRADLNQVTQNDQAAEVRSSSVNGTSTTGAVSIAGNAFQNMSGLSVLNANSGNNVAINAAMNVNISIIPGR